jgi:hypothetical protein
MKKKRNDASQGGPAPVEDARKRKKGAESGTLDDDETRLVKRQRGRLQTLEVFSSSTSPEKEPDVIQTQTVRYTLAAKRYGKKGRTSSPAPSAVTGIDYDELPPSTVIDKWEASSPVQRLRPNRETARKAITVLTGIGKTRASAMRQKDGKLGRSAPMKVKTEKKRTNTRSKQASNKGSMKIADIGAVDLAEKKGTNNQSKQALDTDVVKTTCIVVVNPFENKRITRSNLKKSSSKVVTFFIFTCSPSLMRAFTRERKNHLKQILMMLRWEILMLQLKKLRSFMPR